MAESLYCCNLTQHLGFDIWGLPCVGKKEVSSGEGWLEQGGKEERIWEEQALGLSGLVDLIQKKSNIQYGHS